MRGVRWQKSGSWMARKKTTTDANAFAENRLQFYQVTQPRFVAIGGKFVDLVVEPDLNITTLGGCIEIMSSEKECQILGIHACVFGGRDEILQI